MWCVTVLGMLRIVCVDQVFDEITHKVVCIFFVKNVVDFVSIPSVRRNA
jgi:hypothetical protein